MQSFLPTGIAFGMHLSEVLRLLGSISKCLQEQVQASNVHLTNSAASQTATMRYLGKSRQLMHFAVIEPGGVGFSTSAVE